MFQTEVRRGVGEADWVWDAVPGPRTASAGTWDLPAHSVITGRPIKNWTEDIRIASASLSSRYKLSANQVTMSRFSLGSCYSPPAGPGQGQFRPGGGDSDRAHHPSRPRVTAPAHMRTGAVQRGPTRSSCAAADARKAEIVPQAGGRGEQARHLVTAAGGPKWLPLKTF